MHKLFMALCNLLLNESPWTDSQADGININTQPFNKSKIRLTGRCRITLTGPCGGGSKLEGIINSTQPLIWVDLKTHMMAKS